MTKKKSDSIEKYGKGSLIQHGEENKRVYLMKLHPLDFPGIIDHICDLAKKNRYTKIFCKVPSWAAPHFLSEGFFTEATIPNFYNGSDTAFFMSKILNSDRYLNLEYDKMKGLSQLLKESEPSKAIKKDSNLKPVVLGKDRAEEMAEVYKQVFDSYPFPIFDPKYLIETMDNDVQYFGLEDKGRLVALSSAEMDVKGQNAEMTDFATLPAYRGKGMANMLLVEMERHMKKIDINSLYTIARLNSVAMNKTFQRQNYIYGGTLIKNTNIAGKIESMVVYYKTL